MDADVIHRLQNLHEWVVPSHGLKVETVDAHCAGHALRLVVKGLPVCSGGTMHEREAHARQHLAHLLRSLILEPRGHAEMYGCLLTPQQRSDSHCGALFMHRGGFSPMCGHGVIAIGTILLETGLEDMKAPETRIKIDTPAGLVRVYGKIEGDRVTQVFFENVPAFAVAEDYVVDVPQVGRVTCDIGFGGAFFAFVDASALRLECVPERAADLATAGVFIREAINKSREVVHPADPLLRGVQGVVFVDKPQRRRGNTAQSRHVSVFADGVIDRSPCGMSLSARLAIHAAQGQMALGDGLIVESILGTQLSGKLVARTEIGDQAAMITEIEGRAWITGRHSFLISPDDPFREGFLL